MGASGGPRGLQEGSKRALEGLLGASWALQEAKQSSQEGSLIVLELQVDPVSRKKGPQEGPKRLLKEAQKGSWMGKGENSKIIEKPMVFE